LISSQGRIHVVFDKIAGRDAVCRFGYAVAESVFTMLTAPPLMPVR
jgi:hypothetical protein